MYWLDTAGAARQTKNEDIADNHIVQASTAGLQAIQVLLYRQSLQE